MAQLVRVGALALVVGPASAVVSVPAGQASGCSSSSPESASTRQRWPSQKKWTWLCPARTDCRESSIWVPGLRKGVRRLAESGRPSRPPGVEYG
jgi:hypothetical protein